MLVQLILANVFFSVAAAAGGDVNLPKQLDISLGFKTTWIEDLPIPSDLEMKVVLLGDIYFKGLLFDKKMNTKMEDVIAKVRKVFEFSALGTQIHFTVVAKEKLGIAFDPTSSALTSKTKNIVQGISHEANLYIVFAAIANFDGYHTKIGAICSSRKRHRLVAVSWHGSAEATALHLAREIGHIVGISDDRIMRNNYQFRRYATNGRSLEPCTNVDGVMDWEGRKTTWSSCSKEDFGNYFRETVQMASGYCLALSSIRRDGCLNDGKWYSLTNRGASIVVGTIEWVQVIRDCTAPHLEAENCRFQCADEDNCEYFNLFYGQSSYNNVQFRTYQCTFVSGEQGVPELFVPSIKERSLSGPRACGPEGSMLKESPSQQSVNSGTAISCLTRGFLYKTVDSYGQSSLRKTIKWMQLLRGCTTEQDEVENCRIHCKKNLVCMYINFWYVDEASKAPARRYYTCELLHGKRGVPELVNKMVHAYDATKMSGPRDCKKNG